MRNFLVKLRQVSIGASPIIVIILAVHFFVKPMPTPVSIAFIISVFLLIFGQALFLVGIDRSILLMGELVGNNIRKLKKLWIILLFGFLFGTMATVAEPAVTVLSGNIHALNSSISATLLTWIVSCGIGIFVAYALLRIFKQFSIKWSLGITYLITFILIFFTPKGFQAIAFDFSGATTGVVTVPFILALGVGVTAILGRKDQDDSYGMIGLASIGPIITMCIMGIIFGGGEGGAFPPKTDPNFLASFLSSLQNISIALLPITVIFFIFNFAFIKLPGKKVWQVVFGILTTVIGLTFFLTAVSYGYANAGRHIGEAFTSGKEWLKYLLIPFGLILGFAITYTEVAIRVLAAQVEQNTDGKIKKNTLIFTLAVGLAVAVMFGMLRILFSINILFFIIPMFVFGIICMPFISKMFVGIAFDSGGVASGTITAAFLVPLSIGASNMLGLDPMIYGFGMIAFIASIPIVAISILGLIYVNKLKKAEKEKLRIDLKQKALNNLIGIVVSPQNEKKINEHLENMNAQVITAFNARGSSPSIFNLVDEQKLFMLAMISESNAEKMINILNKEFEYDKHNTGIAFTVPIDKVEL